MRHDAVALALAVALVGAAGKEAAMSFRISSNAFTEGARIPAQYTSDGPNTSPPLAWRDVPKGTQSLALIVDDPDAPDPKAPRKDFVHWVVYDLPIEPHTLPEGVNARTLPKGAREGVNDFREPGWRGPNPPVGEHRYFFRLYALDTVLPDLGRPARPALEHAMRGHILAHAELMGRYKH